MISKFNNLVEENDLDTLDGLAEGAYYQVIATPTTIIIDEEGREVRSWRGVVPSENEIHRLIYQ